MLMINLEINTRQKLVYNDDITSVKVPGSKGPFQILYNHAPIISSLEKGVIHIVDHNDNKILFEIDGGFIECLNNKIIILTNDVKQVSQ